MTIPLLLLLFVFLPPIVSLSAITTNVSSCQGTQRCGNVNVSYPFFIRPRNLSDSLICGFPDYDMTCDDDVLYKESLSSVYRIIKIDMKNKTFVVAENAAFVESGCPKLDRNFTDLSLTADVTNLTFFFDCREDSPSLDDHRISCYSKNTTSTYVFDQMKEGQLLPKDCDRVIEAPVLRSNVVNANLTQNFKAILKLGFEVYWSASVSADCNDCYKSGGLCAAYRNPEKEVEATCVCEDGRRSKPNYCRGGKSTKLSTALISASASVACLAFLVLGYWLFRRKRRGKTKTKSSSRQATSLFRSMSEFSAKSTVDNGDSTYSQTHIFSYKELEKATDGFSADMEIGDGGFGAVYKGVLGDGRIVAVKRPYENNFKRLEQFMNEIAILKQVRHPNLVSLYGCTTHDSQQLLLVYEFVPNGTVADHLALNINPPPLAAERGGGGMNWALRMNIAVEIAEALSYLHSFVPQIIHRDVKTNNILLDNDYHVKVADFGLSRLFPLDVTHVSTAPQGTPGYVDPEYYQCYQLTDKSDVFSFGVVLVELISSKPAVDITRSRHEINLSNMAMNRISNGLVHELADPMLGYETDPEVRRTVEQVAEVAFLCLQSDKDMRPPMKDVKEKLVDIVSKSKCATLFSDSTLTPTMPSPSQSPMSYSNTTISTLDFHSNGSNSISKQVDVSGFLV